MSDEIRDPIKIVLTAAQQLPALLEEAELALRPAALSHASGILVTRHDLRRYSVAIHPGVPFGQTREQSLV